MWPGANAFPSLRCSFFICEMNGWMRSFLSFFLSIFNPLAFFPPSFLFHVFVVHLTCVRLIPAPNELSVLLPVTNVLDKDPEAFLSFRLFLLASIPPMQLPIFLAGKQPPLTPTQALPLVG